eukprot:TRINITY_DN71202_c0_g1_i1.p1 TRINITY_DN71202_c0_g1~~TRINITY_DN71202_c0_g1_i1.p1  ORF type:complete len:213 (-),score=33.36 TRINITY_DN71202_c0_g1_i1:125-763(-)
MDTSSVSFIKRENSDGRIRKVFNANTYKSMRSPVKSAEMRCMSLEGEISSLMSRKTRLGDDDYSHRSHATTFARGGILPGAGIFSTYQRDPTTGVWFRERGGEALDRSYMSSGSPGTQRYYQSSQGSKGGPMGTVLWAAPSGGKNVAFWREPANPPDPCLETSNLPLDVSVPGDATVQFTASLRASASAPTLQSFNASRAARKRQTAQAQLS